MKIKACTLPIKKLFMLLLALLIPATTYADATMPFTRIFTLGDSLTDGGAYSVTVIASGAPAGNLYKFTTNFTDGSAKVWAEYLAAAIGLPLQPNIVSGVLMGVVALTVAGQIADLVDRLLQRSKKLGTVQGNDALILTRLFSVGIFVLTMVGVLVSSGVDLTTLAAFAGALGIGLGFGLQEFVVNFVSGLYVLLERALKVGDYVTIDKITGRVVQMSSRALVVRDAVGTESLIPNSSVIKGVLQNHTLSNDDFRVSFLLKIADVTDYPKARELILQSLMNAPRVLSEPVGEVLIVSVTANEVVLETSFWINDLCNGHKGLVSDLMFEICMRFRTECIHLASQEPLPAANASAQAWPLAQAH